MCYNGQMPFWPITRSVLISQSWMLTLLFRGVVAGGLWTECAWWGCAPASECRPGARYPNPFTCKHIPLASCSCSVIVCSILKMSLLGYDRGCLALFLYFSPMIQALQCLWFRESWPILNLLKGRVQRGWCPGRLHRSTGTPGPAATLMKALWLL